MPIYEFACKTCGNTFESRVARVGARPDACPSCGGSVKKLLSSPAIQFKGSGWYITDYAKKTSGKDARLAGESKDTAAGSAEGSGGSAPAAGGGSKDSTSPAPTPAPKKD